MTHNTKSKRKSMNDDLDESATSDLMIVDLLPTSKPPSKTTKPTPKSVSTPQNDNDNDTDKKLHPLLILTASPQSTTPNGSLFHFKNVPPLPKNTKPSKHKLLADPPTTTKVKSIDKKNLNNMATGDPVYEEEASKRKMATASVNVDKYVPKENPSHQKSIPPF
eukprot:scaffold65609_cov61-Attheya_sp.AAC.3